jgi:hypothetical protein
MRRQARWTGGHVPAAARAFAQLQGEEALLPSGASAMRRSGALFFMLLVLGAVPLLYAASAAGLISEAPAALAKGSNSGPGGDDDDGGGSGGGDDDDDDTGTHTRTGAQAATDDTSANGHSTRGTTDDNDTPHRDRGRGTYADPHGRLLDHWRRGRDWAPSSNPVPSAAFAPAAQRWQ